MSWIKITMKYDGTCIVCNKKIRAKEIGFWLKEESKVKHEKCAEENKELKCAICNGSAGCMDCEFAEICDRESVSKLCICKKCEGVHDSFTLYQKSIVEKFPLLNLKI